MKTLVQQIETASEQLSKLYEEFSGTLYGFDGFGGYTPETLKDKWRKEINMFKRAIDRKRERLDMLCMKASLVANFENLLNEIHTDFFYDTDEVEGTATALATDQEVSANGVTIMWDAEFKANYKCVFQGDCMTPAEYDTSNEEVTPLEINAFYEGIEIPLTKWQKEKIELKIQTNYSL